jgi:chromosome segregation ATPase
MRKSDWMKSGVMVVGLALIALGGYAHQQGSSQQSSGSSQQTGDPVADAARKAREEKEKKAQKPKRVFTDDDVRPAAPEKPAATGATSGAEGAAAAGAKKGDDAKEDPNSEKAWRKRFSEQHQKIANAEKELDILQRELQKSQVQYYPDPTKAMTEQSNRSEINDKTAKIDAKKKELEQLRHELDDMEADLRKAGGDPGWAQ